VQVESRESYILKQSCDGSSRLTWLATAFPSIRPSRISLKIIDNVVRMSHYCVDQNSTDLIVWFFCVKVEQAVP
jgi:hypothetical protein